jgi:hypothetical protein
MKTVITTWFKRIIPAIVILAFFVGVYGCQKQEGPMEKAGKKADEGIEATNDAMKEAGEKMKEGAEKTSDAMKNAAKKVEEKVK